MVRYTNRRKMLKALAGTSIGVSIAGCSSNQQGDGNDGSGSDGNDKSGGSQDIEAGDIEALKKISPDEWRKKVSREAQKELEGKNLQFYTVSKNDEWLNTLRDHDYQGPYEPLTNSINIVQQSGDTLTQRYIRETKSDKKHIDVTDVSNMDTLINDGIPFGNLTHIPSYRAFPEANKIHPQFGYKNQNAYGLAYNTDMVSNPPQKWDDLLADQFAGGKIVLDWTPKTIMMPVMLDIKGESWLQKLGSQNPTMIKSTYSVPKTVAQGEYSVAYLANYKHTLKFKGNGLPTDIVKSADACYPTVAPMGYASNPQHPWASYLFLDKYFQWTDMQVLVPGSIAADRSAADPPELLDLIEGKAPPAMFRFEKGVSEYETTYQKAIGAPTA